ncbi:MAG: SDR family oxidoreductase, partial [Clostridia bacterium]|nr:SDR family oxidoreductase [Clostridia bacterium]
MKIFVTGGTGNIGQYVTKALLEAGHEIVLLTRTPERIPGYLTMENVTVVRGNILDLEIMGEALQGCD